MADTFQHGGQRLGKYSRKCPDLNIFLLTQDVAKTRIMLAPAGSKEASLGNISSN